MTSIVRQLATYDDSPLKKSKGGFRIGKAKKEKSKKVKY